MLRNNCKDKPEIKFLQFNTDKLATPEQTASQTTEGSGAEEAVPLVFASDPASQAQQFIGIKADTPFMTIIDTEGKVKYAGTAGDFVPAFILTELTGIEIDLAKQQQVQQGRAMPDQMAAPEMLDPMTMEMMMRKTPIKPAKPAKPLGDPNKPAIDPNTPAKTTKAVSPSPQPVSDKKPVDIPTLSLEDQIRAEKLLQSAQMEIETKLKLRSNPKRGIEDCRKILAEFPNTPYAQKAREFLRQVPKRYQEMNDITDEELGY
jgi:hypothetical protein